jgi:putative holliday junction resolvase
MAILALDPGKRKIGAAVTDETGLTVAQLGNVPRKPDDTLLTELKHLLAGRRVDLVVIGLPLNMDGSEGVGARSARQLGDLIFRKMAVPVEFHDERLTTFEAKERLKGRLARGKLKSSLDSAAAAVLLESWMAARGRP